MPIGIATGGAIQCAVGRMTDSMITQTDIELPSTTDKMSELDYLLATLKVVLSPCVARPAKVTWGDSVTPRATPVAPGVTAPHVCKPCAGTKKGAQAEACAPWAMLQQWSFASRCHTTFWPPFPRRRCA